MSNASTLHPKSDILVDVEIVFECMVDALLERGWDIGDIAAMVADRADDLVLDAYRMKQPATAMLLHSA